MSARRRALPARRAGRRRVPCILQTEATECGAVSLAMVLAAHGRWVPIDALRTACGVSRDGSKAANLLKAGRGFGLAAKAFRYSSVEPLRDLPMPAIVFVDLNHFLVLEGFRGGRVHLCDPAIGRRRLTVAEFGRMFSGIALTFEPGPEFEPGGRPASTARRLFSWTQGSRDAVAMTLLLGVLLIVPGVVTPTFLRIFTDYYLIDGQTDWIGWMLLIMLAGVAIQGTLTWMHGYFMGRLTTRIAVMAGGRFVRRMLRLPMLFYAQRYPGSISNRLERANALAGHAAADITGLVVGSVSVLTFGAIMVTYSPILAAVGFAVSSIMLATFLMSRRHLEESGQQSAALGNKLSAATMQGISMMETLKASGTEDAFFSRWSGQLALAANEQQRIGTVRARLAVVPEIVNTTGTLAVLVVGGLLVLRGDITIGLLVAFQSLQGSFTGAVQRVSATATTFSQSRGLLDQLDDVLETPEAAEFAGGDASPSPPAGGGLGRPMHLRGRIGVRDLRFGYSITGQPLLDGLNLDLAPGSWVALVGGSGSGKSTVARLVCGLFEPRSGTILYDGRPLVEIPRAVLRNSVAVVDQEVVLFEGSIRDNITLWDDTVSDAEVIRAARDAGIHDDIMMRPGGYDAPVAERGRNFSGGQCQRLELARALVRDPSVLVLDEATSALDPEIERRIILNLRRRGCTCLIVAHRLSTIRDCDEIVVMERGRVLERGDHETLVRSDGPYSRLVET